MSCPICGSICGVGGDLCMRCGSRKGPGPIMLPTQNVFDATQLHCIVKNIYLSNLIGAHELWKLRVHEIRAVVNCSDYRDGHPTFCPHLRIAIRDHPAQDLGPYFDLVLNFMREQVLQRQNILVHCNMGVSRSPSFVAAYLIRFHRLSLDHALRLISSKRRCIAPNDGFLLQLHHFEQREKSLGLQKDNVNEQ